MDIDALCTAAQGGDLAAIAAWVDAGGPLDVFDDVGKSPLSYAAEAEQLRAVRALLAAGAPVNAFDEARGGNTALRHCAATCSYDMAKLLVEAGADSSIPGGMQVTALDQARRRTHGDGPRVAQLLALPPAIKARRRRP